MSEGPPVEPVADDPAAGVAPSETQFVPDEPAPPAAPAPHVGALPRFGRYRAVAQLGEGAMGSVYRATDDVLGRAVAIKTLKTQGAEGRARFHHEVRAIGAALHPNILAIYDAGTEGGTPYLVMELAAGGSLRERIQAGPVAVDVVRTIGIQIAHALATAHAAGVLHRDLKPGNILAVQDGVWKLADFGIARLPDSTLTATGQFIGSPSYAAPESLRAGLFSPASDVYGLAATLYEALAGAPPHGDHDMPSVIRKLDEEPPPLPAWCAVPEPLAAAVMAALARDPARRPTADQLARWLASGDAATPPVEVRAWSRRSKIGVVVFAAAAVMLLVLAVLHRERGAAAPAEAAVAGSAAPIAAPAKPPATSNPPPPAATAEPAIAAEPAAPTEPAAPGEPGDTADPGALEDAFEAARAHAFGDPGTVVDEARAREIVEELEREARTELDGIGDDRGRARRGGRDRWSRRFWRPRD